MQKAEASHTNRYAHGRSRFLIRELTNRYPVQPFDKVAPKYDEIVASADDFPFAGYCEVLDKATCLSEAFPGMSILDLGIGTGEFAQRFDALGCRIWGIDFSVEMLVKAKAKLPQAVLQQADIMAEWPADFQRRFDRVVSSYALHHFTLPEKSNLLKRVADRFLKRDGRIIVADVSFPTVVDRQKTRESLKKEWEDNEYYWACDETTSALSKVGFQVQYSQVSVYSGIYVINKSTFNHDKGTSGNILA